MATMLILAIGWGIRGILSLLGIRFIPDNYKEKSWTKNYIYHLGISDLMIACPWLILYIATRYNDIDKFMVMFIMLAVSIPGIVYTFVYDRKYKAMLKSNQI